MRNKKIVFLIALSLVIMLLYLFIWLWGLDLNTIRFSSFMRISQRRFIHLIAMSVSAILLSMSSLSFQTLTHNRILTPSILGYEALYSGLQTVLLFFLGSQSILMTSNLMNFSLTTGVMMIVSLALYGTLLKVYRNHLGILLLFGILLSNLLRSTTSFIQILLDPNEFQSLVILTSVNINSISPQLVYIALPLMLLCIIGFIRMAYLYDVILLGESSAVSLGLDYPKAQRNTLLLISVSLSVSTALMGPMTFLGLIAVSISRQWIKHYKHSIQLISSSCIGLIFLVLSQILVEKTAYISTVSVVMNLIGASFVTVLLFKEFKHD